jgi:predicted nucleic-acid-binding Zn-ribbon protein
MQAQTHAAKVSTDRTCWKCGEETLKETSVAVEANAFRSSKAVASGVQKSECTKCGATSVNAEQARHNKIVGRRNRKAIIKESNRKSG